MYEKLEIISSFFYLYNVTNQKPIKMKTNKKSSFGTTIITFIIFIVLFLGIRVLFFGKFGEVSYREITELKFESFVFAVLPISIILYFIYKKL